MVTGGVGTACSVKQVESVLVVRRQDNGKLACIGGFVEVGETLEEATRREVKEETGLDVTSLQMLPRVSERRRPRAAFVCVCVCVRVRLCSGTNDVRVLTLYSCFLERLLISLLRRMFRINKSISVSRFRADTMKKWARERGNGAHLVATLSKAWQAVFVCAV